MKYLCTMLMILLFPLLVYATDGISVRWTSLGGESEAYDSMMEKAAFVDVPRRDLISVAWRMAPSAKPEHHQEAQARICHWRAWVLASESSDSALMLQRKALQLCDSMKYPYDHLRFSLGLADMYRVRGQYADAYYIYRSKLGLLEHFGDRFWEAKALVSLGRIMQDLGEIHEANWYYSEAQDIFQRIGSRSCATKNRINLANVSYMLGDKQRGLDFLHDLELEDCVASDSAYMANVLVSRYYISDGADGDAAVKARRVAGELNNPSLDNLTAVAMGHLQLMSHDYRGAVNYLRHAYQLSVRLHNFPDQKRALEGMQEAYQMAGNKDSAGYCRQMMLMLGDSIYHREKIESLKKQEHLATINRYETSIREADERHRWRQRLFLGIGGGLCVIFSMALALLWLSRRKTEADRRLEEEKNERLELENLQQKREIEAKEKELTSNTLLLAQKNAKLKELAARVREMESRGEISAAEGNSLSDSIGDEIKVSDDWRFFKLNFEKVHPCFFEALKSAYPSLSRTEQRLCAYIRVGMTAKEIAQILSVKPDTVNTSRYRIRKKMNLAPTDSLEAIISTL